MTSILLVTLHGLLALLGLVLGASIGIVALYIFEGDLKYLRRDLIALQVIFKIWKERRALRRRFKEIAKQDFPTPVTPPATFTFSEHKDPRPSGPAHNRIYGDLVRYHGVDPLEGKDRT